MTKLRKPEIQVLEKIREGKTPAQISREIGMPKGNVTSTIARLSELSVIERVSRGKYQVIIPSYEKTDLVNGGRARSPRQLIVISPEQEAYIRSNIALNRSELARRLKQDKVTLNLMIMQLGLGRSSG